MCIVEISYLRLLEEISQKLAIEPPRCEVIVTGDGWFLAYIDLEIVHVRPIIETSRCWGAPSRNILLTKEDAARVAIKKMREQFALHIKDANYDDYMLYKDLYDHLAVQYNDVLDRLNILEQEHNVLKDCYALALAEKNEIMRGQEKMHCEREKMHREIEEYRMIIDSLRAEQLATPSNPSEAGSAS